MKNTRQQLPAGTWAPILLLALLAAAGAAYLPGLHSGFLLDDLPNLLGLETVKNGARDAWIAFVTEGRSGPLGRPVALASFALQADAWPSDPAAFKQVNLAIHLFNGMLLYLLAIRLARIGGLRRPEVAAMAIAATWVLLPIHVGNVLYIVQRMTLLAATFALLGLLAYLYVRELDGERRRWPGPLALALLGACTALSALSKEVGVLALPLVFLLEWSANRQQAASRNWKLTAWSSLAIGLLAALLLFIKDFHRLVIEGYAARPFTLAERVMTQPGVLLDYLAKIILPDPYTLGIFNETFPLATGWQDWLLPVVVLLAMAALAVFMAKRAMLVTIGIAWFFIGHALESTIFPLEIYFEHRNYFPSIGIVVAAVGMVQYLAGFLPAQWQRHLPRALLLLAIIGYTILTGRTAALWSRPIDQAYLWSLAQPDSVRARLHLLSTTLDYRQMEMAERVLDGIHEDFPLLPHADIYALDSRCYSDALEVPDTSSLVEKILSTPHFKGTYGAFNSVLMRFEDETDCKHLELEELKDILLAWALKETEPDRLRRALMLLARSQYLLGDLQSAMIHLNYAAEISDYGSIRLTQAEWLAGAGFMEDAARYLEMARENYRRSGWHFPADRFDAMEARLAEERLPDDPQSPSK